MITVVQTSCYAKMTPPWMAEFLHSWHFLLSVLFSSVLGFSSQRTIYPRDKRPGNCVMLYNLAKVFSEIW